MRSSSRSRFPALTRRHREAIARPRRYAGVTRPYPEAVIAIDVEGNGASLVLLHGVGANRAIWSRVTPLLAPHRLVAAPDLPGFGASPPGGHGFELDRVADRLGDALEIDVPVPFDLLGHSLGGAVALVLAARRPKLVRRLILAAPAGLAPRRAPLPALASVAGSALIGARRRVGPPLAWSASARRILLLGVVADGARLPPDEVRRMLRGSAHSSRIGAAIQAVAAADLRPQLAGLAVPVAFVWGDRDHVVPISSLRSLRALVPGAATEIIPGAGHVPQVERAREFASAVERLLAGSPVRDIHPSS
jgi:pimeloyl-ACP methyl ester carboxylesterase